MLKSTAAQCLWGPWNRHIPSLEDQGDSFFQKTSHELSPKKSVGVFKVNKWEERDQNLRKKRYYAEKPACIRAQKKESTMHGGWGCRRLPAQSLAGDDRGRSGEHRDGLGHQPGDRV